MIFIFHERHNIDTAFPAVKNIYAIVYVFILVLGCFNNYTMHILPINLINFMWVL